MTVKMHELNPMYATELLKPMEIVKMDGIITEYKNPLVIYHGNCADGFSAAWVFHHMQDKIQQNFDFHAGVYQEAPPDVTDRIVYLVDFSYKSAAVMRMLTKASSIILIDHHKTAIEDLKPLFDDPKFCAYVDLERSGAMLAWDYWNNTRWGTPETYTSGGWKRLFSESKPGDHDYVSPPILLDHVQDRDLWKFKLPLTREIQANVFSYEYTFENWDKLMLDTNTVVLAEGGQAIERKHFKDIKELIKVAQREFILEIDAGNLGVDHICVPVLNCPYMWASDAGHLMAATHPSKIGVTYYDTSKARIFSLRSLDDGPDVSLIATLYGGGGHKHAAGFSVSRDHILARC